MADTFSMSARDFEATRRKFGLTQPQLAQVLGFSGNDCFPVSLWEAGHMPIPPQPSALMLIFQETPRVLYRMAQMIDLDLPQANDPDPSDT